MDDFPIPLKRKTRRLKSLNEFKEPHWKGLFEPWRKDDVPNWLVVAIGFGAGLAIGIFYLVAT